MYKLTNAEVETTIRWDKEERIAHIFTSDPTYIRKLDKLCEEAPSEYQCVWEDPDYGSKKYTCPAKRVHFGKPASDEKIKANRENLARFKSES